jgi:hypothetical protein
MENSFNYTTSMNVDNQQVQKLPDPQRQQHDQQRLQSSTIVPMPMSVPESMSESESLPGPVTLPLLPSSEIPTSFKLLIEGGQWSTIRTFLKTALSSSLSPSQLLTCQNQNARLGYLLCQARYESNLTCLGLAICHGAPIDILQDMIRIDPSLPTIRDTYGLTVLHLGCLNGAPLRIIEYLLDLDKQQQNKYSHDSSLGLPRILDNDRRSPLHHAVEYACCSIMDIVDDEYNYPVSYYIIALQKICLSAPEMVFVQDYDGITPIDMVQDIKAETKLDSKAFERLDIIYQVLKVTSIHVYKTNQRRWEGWDEKRQNNTTIISRNYKKRSSSSNTSSSSSKRSDSYSNSTHSLSL